MKKLILLVILLAIGYLTRAQCDPENDVYSVEDANAVCIEVLDNVRMFYVNNYPDHTDSYNSSFTLTASDEEYSMCAYPEEATSFTPLYEATKSTQGCTDTYTFGVGTNGVKYDPSSAKLFENTSTGENNNDWHIEARFIFSQNFGNNGGHLNPFGEYHYHDVPADYFATDLSIDGSSHSPIVGYAADGFPIYYKYVYTDVTDATSSVLEVSSGFSLRSGTRSGDGVSAPDGDYTGLYYEDYEHLASNAELDECNGRYGVTPDFPYGTYYYVLTDNYPYIPRCFKGTVIDHSFRIGPSAACPSSTASTDCSVAISGCMDPFSSNYNANANLDDGSCAYAACTIAVTVTGTEVSTSGGSDGTATATISGGQGTIAYLWSNGETTATISGLTEGTYTVTVTDDNEADCTAEGSFTLVFTAGCDDEASEITSWILNNGEFGSLYTRDNFTPATMSVLANVQEVSYSDDYVYIQSTGIPSYAIGPHDGDGNPATPGDVGYIFKIPRSPVEETGTKEAPGLGHIGVFINGVPIYNYADAVSYNELGIWNRNAVVAEVLGFDCSKGHPSPNMGDLNNSYFHHHQNPSAYNVSTSPPSTACDSYPSDGLYSMDSGVHSPLIGFAFDGYPVYGSYGYDDPLDASSGIVRIVSGFEYRDITERTTLSDGTALTSSEYGPAVDTDNPIGTYKEDFEYKGLGHLDTNNMRYCITPEYPNGTYAYFATVDADLNSMYPYIIGEYYFGSVVYDNFSTSETGSGTTQVSVSEAVTVWDGEVVCNSEATCTTPTISGVSGLCIAESSTLTASDAGGTWSSSDIAIGTVDATSGNFIAIAAGSSVITYTLSSCVSEGYLITVNDLPTVFANASSDQVCAGESVALTGSGATTYVWDNEVNDGESFVPTTTTTFQVKGEDDLGCTGYAEITVVVNALPVVTANTTNNEICQGDRITLTGGGASTYNWDKNVVDGQEFEPPESTAYTVIGTDENGCSSLAEIDITVNIVQTPLVSLEGESLSSSIGDASFQWINCVDNTEIENANGRTYIPTESGDYAVTISQNGCFATSACFGYELVLAIDDAVNAVSIYPNPARDRFIIKMPSDSKEETTVQIINLSGDMVWTISGAGLGDIEIATDQWPIGMYIVYVSSDQKNEWKRVMVE